MTVLKQFQRLEAQGVWRPAPEARRLDVIVSLGDATLILTDPRSERPLSHWSLPAAVRVNPGEMPARYIPDGDSDEELEIDDDLMIAAIDKVHRTIEANRPHPGRLRRWLMQGAGVIMVILAIFWLPPAMVRHTALTLPPAVEKAVGMAVLADVNRVTGGACSGPSASVALKRLARRLLGDDGQIEVQRMPQPTLALPGHIILISDRALASAPTPEAFAGYVLAARTSAQPQNAQARNTQDSESPLLSALRFAGTRASFHLLTRGTVTESSFLGYADALLATPQPRPDDDRLIMAFADAGVPSQPYARAVDLTGESTLPLIEADPFRDVMTEPLMSDRDWAALQLICD